MSLVTIENLSAGYGKEKIVRNISFAVNEGELAGLVGLNGSGKSTLAKAICNLLPHEGNVFINGAAAEKQKPKDLANLISYMPQHSGLGLDISVLDVVLMGFNAKLRLLESPSRAMKEQAVKTIELVGLSEKIYSNYMTLSEGQKQLVILARALVSEADFMVLDEPESALDFSVRYKLMRLAGAWIADGHRAGLAILHDLSLALNCCSRLILLKDGEICGMIAPKKDTLEEMEQNLQKVYGDVSLIKNTDSRGKEVFTMIHNSEEE